MELPNFANLKPVGTPNGGQPNFANLQPGVFQKAQTGLQIAQANPSQHVFNQAIPNNQAIDPKAKQNTSIGFGGALSAVGEGIKQTGQGLTHGYVSPEVINPISVVKNAAEPALKGLATGVRTLQSTPDVIKAFGGNQQAFQKATETMAQPIMGQKTLAGDTTGGNLMSAANAGANLLGAKIGGSKAFTNTAETGLNALKSDVSAVGNTAQKVLDTVHNAGEARVAAKDSAATWKMIQPELSKTDLAKAVKSGDIATKGKLGTVTQIAKGRNAQMVEAAKPFVSNAKDPIEAVSNMQQGIADEATKLRQGLQQSNATWNQNNLKGAISKVINESDNLVGDSAAAFKKTTNAVLQEANKADKNLSGLLDVRQKFDARVAAQYPNIYDSSNSAIKVAVTKTRSAINQMIEDALPNGQTIDGVSFRDSLKKQSLLYDAIDNTAPKTGKIGTNAITRFAKNNPKTTKAAITAATALGGGEILKHTGILP